MHKTGEFRPFFIHFQPTRRHCKTEKLICFWASYGKYFFVPLHPH